MSYPSGTDQMRLPIGAGQICKPDRVSCVVHPVIAHINPNVRDIIAAVIRPLKEHQIAGLRILERDAPDHVMLRLCDAFYCTTRAVYNIRSMDCRFGDLTVFERLDSSTDSQNVIVRCEDGCIGPISSELIRTAEVSVRIFTNIECDHHS